MTDREAPRSPTRRALSSGRGAGSSRRPRSSATGASPPRCLDQLCGTLGCDESARICSTIEHQASLGFNEPDAHRPSASSLMTESGQVAVADIACRRHECKCPERRQRIRFWATDMEGKVSELSKEHEEVKAQRAKLVVQRTSLEVSALTVSETPPAAVPSNRFVSKQLRCNVRAQRRDCPRRSPQLLLS